MPLKTSRRHPLYNRLAQAVPPIYADAVTAVAWDDDHPLEDAEGVAYLVTQPCPQIRRWAKQLRALHRKDKTYQVDEGISPLSLRPMFAQELNTIGVVELDLFNKTGRVVRTARAGHRLYWTLPLVLVVADRAEGDAVGFVSFQIKWALCAEVADDEAVDLEIELGQAWIAPAFRGRGWGELAAIGIAFVTRAHVDQVQLTTRWPRGFQSALSVTVAADVYSRSGAAVLQRCAEFVSLQLELAMEQQHFQIESVLCDPRW